MAFPQNDWVLLRRGCSLDVYELKHVWGVCVYVHVCGSCMVHMACGEGVCVWNVWYMYVWDVSM